METEVPLAVVVLKPDCQLTEEEIINFVNERVSDIKKLRGGAVFVDCLPRNAQSKLLKHVLKDKYKNHVPPHKEYPNLAEIGTAYPRRV